MPGSVEDDATDAADDGELATALVVSDSDSDSVFLLLSDAAGPIDDELPLKAVSTGWAR